MLETIAGYRLLTPFQTAGSGSARWCIAAKAGRRYFLKEFLSPVYPADPLSPLGRRQLERCRRFEGRRQRLYAAVSCVIGDVLVPVVDFFRLGGHYYAVSEAMPEGCWTAEQAFRLSDGEKQTLLHQLALGMQRLHAQGVVHGDLKPEHVLLVERDGRRQIRIIDLDSGFLTEEPPLENRDMEGDPAYLAPEMFLRMAGRQAALGPALDVFSLGAVIHQFWTGRMPAFDHERYRYLYEAALDGGEIRLELPGPWTPAIQSMLCAQPDMRPADAAITALFAPKPESSRCGADNGLKRLMRT